MKIDFLQQLINYDGEPMAEIRTKKNAKSLPKGEELTESVPVTLGDVSIAALMREQPGETMEVTEKLRRFTLAQLIAKTKEGPVTMDTEDVAFIKVAIGKTMQIVVVGAAFALIESEPEKPKAKP